MCLPRHQPLLNEQRGDQVKLHVRRVEFGAGAHEAARFSGVRRQWPAALRLELRQVLLVQRTEQAALAVAEVDHARHGMIDQVEPDARNLGHQGNLKRRELARAANAGQHQQLG
jgi:hypothetical protein